MSMQPAEPARMGGRRLTGLLAGWASAHRLTARQAEVIRQGIVAEPAPRGFDWWWRLLDPEGGSAFRGLSGSTGWEIALRADQPSISLPTAWMPSVSGLATWADDDAEFQPYLRLT